MAAGPVELRSTKVGWMMCSCPGRGGGGVAVAAAGEEGAEGGGRDIGAGDGEGW